MTKAAVTFRFAALAALASAFAVPAVAAPTLEQMKAESGMRFTETSGLGDAKSDAAPVWAGKAYGRRADFTVVTPKPAHKPDAPPPAPAPEPPTPPAPNASGLSLGAKLLVGAGNLAGAALTVSLVAAWGPAPLVLLGVAGAVTAATNAYRNGDRGWKLAKETGLGAVTGAASLALVGMAAGLALGRGLERLFRP